MLGPISRASSLAVLLAAWPTLAFGGVLTGAPSFPDQQPPLPDASLRSSLAPPAFGPPPISGDVSSIWTGLYFGVNAGYAVDGSREVDVGAFPLNPNANPTSSAPITASLTPNASSFIGGGQVGYSHLFSPSIVMGVETDIQGAGLTGASTAVNSSPALLNGAIGTYTNYGEVAASKSLQYLGTIRGRVGYLLTPAVNAYATGGLAYGQVSLNTTTFENRILNASGASSIFAQGGTNYSDTRVGWTVGGGIEAALTPHWSLKAEYLYYDLGAASQYTTFFNTYNNAPNTLLVLAASKSTTSYNGHVGRLGVNYHLGYAPAPIMAKY
ncbi:MAG: outer membrane beta-barrel protein [Methylocystis sp.]